MTAKGHSDIERPLHTVATALAAIGRDIWQDLGWPWLERHIPSVVWGCWCERNRKCKTNFYVLKNKFLDAIINVVIRSLWRREGGFRIWIEGHQRAPPTSHRWQPIGSGSRSSQFFSRPVPLNPLSSSSASAISTPQANPSERTDSDNIWRWVTQPFPSPRTSWLVVPPLPSPKPQWPPLRESSCSSRCVSMSFNSQFFFSSFFNQAQLRMSVAPNRPHPSCCCIFTGWWWNRCCINNGEMKG